MEQWGTGGTGVLRYWSSGGVNPIRCSDWKIKIYGLNRGENLNRSRKNKQGDCRVRLS